MSSTLNVDPTDAVVRRSSDGVLSSLLTVAAAETVIRSHAMNGSATVQQWQTTDRQGRPLRVVLVDDAPAYYPGDGLVFEIRAGYRLGRNVPTFPGLEQFEPDGSLELPERAAEFEAFATEHGWATSVTVADDVVVVTAGTAHRLPFPSHLIDPTLAESSFTLTWKRRLGRWTLRTQDSRADGRYWGYSSQARIREYIAEHPFTMPAPATV